MNMRNGVILLTALLAALPTRGQTPVVPATAVPAEATCQIHVWATDNPKSYLGSFSAAFGGGALGAALDQQLPDNNAMLVLIREVTGADSRAWGLPRLIWV